jgi:hypothetical protein
MLHPDKSGLQHDKNASVILEGVTTTEESGEWGIQSFYLSTQDASSRFIGIPA